MARVTGPLMSIDASGSLAGSIVFAKWRGRNYVRRHAVPSNPRTPAQLAARAIIAFLGAVWKDLAAELQATWEEGSKSLNISAFNEYIRLNARDWRDQIGPSQASPPARVKVPGVATSLVGVVSGRQVQLTLTMTPGTADWGVALCRSLVTGFTASPANAIQLGQGSIDNMVMVDGPLAPGTYFYKFLIFTEDGVLGTASSQEEVEIV